MKPYEVIRQAAANANMPLRQIGRKLDKPDNYVTHADSTGRVPRVDTMSAMLGVCGYALVAVPVDSVPPDALIIDVPAAPTN